jgi:hypothetical protein
MNLRRHFFVQCSPTLTTINAIDIMLYASRDHDPRRVPV